LNTDDVIQVMTGTGVGWGDPMERPLELVKEDLKNGYITLGQRGKSHCGYTADFEYSNAADLTGANLQNAVMTNANLKEVVLKEADLAEAG